MIEQSAIAFFGIASIWLSQDRRARVARFACLFGICAQPFWLFTSWQHGQYGIFALTLFYTFGWSRGIWNFWIAPKAIA